MNREEDPGVIGALEAPEAQEATEATEEDLVIVQRLKEKAQAKREQT